jgi:hypothetical protein
MRGHRRGLMLLVVVALVAAACGETVTVTNRTNIGLRVKVDETSFFLDIHDEYTEWVVPGAVNVTVVKEDQWVAAVQSIRDHLTLDLANPDGWSPEEIIGAVAELTDITAHLDAAAQTTGGASCQIYVEIDGSGDVVVTSGGANLAASCSATAPK